MYIVVYIHTYSVAALDRLRSEVLSSHIVLTPPQNVVLTPNIGVFQPRSIQNAEEEDNRVVTVSR